MIVTDLPDGDLHMIQQADHALTSGSIAKAWRRPAFLSEPVWEEFIIAAGHHDQGWDLTDADAPVDERGRPVNFKNCPAGRHIRIWQRTLELARPRGDYGRLLIASHARWLYTHIQSIDNDAQAQAQDFITQLDQMMAELLEKLARDSRYAQAVDPRHFDLSRKLFSFFDALSLVFVRGLEWISFVDDLPVGDGVLRIKIHGEICSIRWGRMTPWPFMEDDVTFTLPVKRIPGRAYTDSNDLRKTLNATPAVVRHYTLGRL